MDTEAGRQSFLERKTNKGSDFRNFNLYDVYGAAFQPFMDACRIQNGKPSESIVSQFKERGYLDIESRVIAACDRQRRKFCGLKIRLQTAPNILRKSA